MWPLNTEKRSAISKQLAKVLLQHYYILSYVFVFNVYMLSHIFSLAFVSIIRITKQGHDVSAGGRLTQTNDAPPVNSSEKREKKILPQCITLCYLVLGFYYTYVFFLFSSDLYL